MKWVQRAVGWLAQDDAGQDLVEYGVLAALIAVFAFGAVSVLGDTITNTFWRQVVELARSL